MTVTAEADASRVDLAVAEQQFTKVYAEYWDRTRQFIASRLDRNQEHLAEDMAQETFILLWTSYVLKGRLASVDHPFGLLATIGRTVIGKHYRSKCRSRLERTTDFGDPANTPIIAKKHVYVDESPELAQQGRDFDEAMAEMTEASQVWRDKDKLRVRLLRSLRSGREWQGGLTPEHRARLEAAAAAATEDEATALQTFRKACLAVASLRVELEQGAGPNWRSSTGMPASAWKNHNPPGWTTDIDRTHCPNGHPLTRDNITFNAEAGRVCMPCRADSAQKQLPSPKTGGAARQTVTADRIAHARALLLDPATKRSVEAVRRETGIATATLHARIPNLAQLRRELYDAPQLVSA